MDDILPLDQLRALVAFVQTGSCKAAAERIFRSEAAVSVQLKKLEANIGKPLLYKSGRRMVLTPLGHEVVEDAQKILSICKGIRRKAENETEEQSLKIGAPDDYMSLLNEITSALKKMRPRLHFDVICLPSHELRPLLQKGELDLALISCEDDKEEGLTLRRLPIVWTGSAPAPILPKGPLPLAFFPKGCLMRRRATEALSALGQPHEVICTSGNIHILQNIVQSGLGYAPFIDLGLPQGIHRIKAPLPDLGEVVVKLICAKGLDDEWKNLIHKAVS